MVVEGGGSGERGGGRLEAKVMEVNDRVGSLR